jgi:ariadne-1
MLKEEYERRQKAELECKKRWEAVELKRKREEEETLKLINEMQEQEDVERELRRQKVEEGNPTNCDICLEQIATKDLLPLDRCGHLFHPSCLQTHFQNEIESRKLPLLCPLCRVEISIMDIKDFLTIQLQAKWEEYTFKKAVESNPEDFSFCPTPNCSYVFVWDQKNTTDFTCPTCKKHYCLNCRCAYHDGQTCQEYQISSKFTVRMLSEI